MLNKLFISKLILISVVTLSCANSPEMKETETDKNISTISLASEGEPGSPLTIYGEVVDSITNKPVPNARIYFYHADVNGQYLPNNPNDESTAKLSGEVTTGNSGKFIVNTVIPGEYDMPGNRHIHIHYVKAEGYKNYGKVILFENDVNDEVRKWANDTGFGIIIDLADKNGVAVGNISLKLIRE